MKYDINSPGFILGALANSFNWFDESIQRSLEQSGWQRVSRTQSLILIYVQAGITRPSDISKILGISRQAIHKSLKELIDRNIIELHPDENDKRATVIVFSDKSQDFHVAAAAIIKNAETQLQKRIGKENLVSLKELLALNWGSIVSVDLRDTKK